MILITILKQLLDQNKNIVSNFTNMSKKSEKKKKKDIVPSFLFTSSPQCAAPFYQKLF
ncbi:protein of unknown function [Paenibacillus alvei]|uniref:Uncharacterized protein n=1 Tax=Paenibacillus alvei TaxID=44250 RepID=A0A383RIC8_PAEAL|nr:protein of unknown function [Paenibacillus alvei]